MTDAKKIVLEKYPTCHAALLAGSVIRGDETKTSDLDIIIFDFSVEGAYRESFYSHDWPVEMFVYNSFSYRDFIDMDCQHGTPSLPRMISEGMPLMGADIIAPIQKEAIARLAAGPESWDEEIINWKRYIITDLLEDLKGAKQRAEQLFTVNALAQLLQEFYLRVNGQWTGKGKWVIRTLRDYDEAYAKQYTSALDEFYRTGNIEGIVHITDDTIRPFGGRLFEGFTLGKNNCNK